MGFEASFKTVQGFSQSNRLWKMIPVGARNANVWSPFDLRFVRGIDRRFEDRRGHEAEWGTRSSEM